MQLRRGVFGVALGLFACGAGAGLVACLDLFHSTHDIETACEIDAARPGCPRPRAVVDAGTDFCAWTREEADTNARSACSWLGACETPLGNNAFGPCYFRALMAFDCEANPNHPVRGE